MVANFTNMVNIVDGDLHVSSDKSLAIIDSSMAEPTYRSLYGPDHEQEKTNVVSDPALLLPLVNNTPHDHGYVVRSHNVDCI